jgi:hypothetical protein
MDPAVKYDVHRLIIFSVIVEVFAGSILRAQD